MKFDDPIWIPPWITFFIGLTIGAILGLYLATDFNAPHIIYVYPDGRTRTFPNQDKKTLKIQQWPQNPGPSKTNPKKP